MHKVFNSCVTLFLIAMVFFSLASCNNNLADVPFPLADSVFPQPATTPLKIGEPRKIEWITVKNGVIKPTVKNVDLKNLPSVPYDADGFKPFSSAPEETRFDFNSLPERDFTPEKVAWQKFKFKTSVLEPPTITKAVPVAPRAGTPLSVFDIGKFQGLPTKAVLALLKDKAGGLWIGTDLGLFRFDGENMQAYGSLVKGAVGALIEDNMGRIWYMRRRGIGMIDPKHGIQYFSTELICPFPGYPTFMKDEKGNIWITQITKKSVVMIDPASLSYKKLDESAGITGSDHWIFKDEKKQIWLSSNTGVDIITAAGNKIKHLDKTNGLSSDTLEAIIADPKGRIWIAVKNDGLNSVDIERGTIKRYGSLQGLKNVKTFKLLCDDKDRIWLATANRFAVLDTKRNRVKYSSDDEGITNDFILSMEKDDRNRIWIGTNQTGLYIVDQNAEIVNTLEKKQIVSLFEDTGGNIWSGTNEGIWILDDEKKQMQHLYKANGLGDNFVQSFVQTGKKLWVTTNGGFDLIDFARNTIEHTGKNEGLISDTVYAVIKDTRGNTWLAGPSEGLQVYDSVKKIVLQLNMENGLGDDNVSDVTIDRDGNVWIATNQGGVDIIDPDLATIRNLNSAPGLRDTSLRILQLDAEGRMWIGSGKGVYRADIKKGTLTTITTAEGLSNNYITSFSLYKDMLVAGTRRGVSIIKPPISSDGTFA